MGSLPALKPILTQLAERVRTAITEIGADVDPAIQRAQDPKFGDYQSNCAMGLAKKLGKNPREVAGLLLEAIKVDDLCDRPEIAGPGFINFRLKPSFLSRCLEAIPPARTSEGDRLGIPPVSNPETVVVDLSSPNLAKEMHVGHLRSTVIGDCIARLLEWAGHAVHRENHVGDWGTQFGMLVAHLRRARPDLVDSARNLAISDLESFYVEAKARFDADEDFRAESRRTVVALQQGDAATRRIWRSFCDESLRHCHAIYDRLDVRLIDRGESFYADRMEQIVTRLEAMKGDGADDLVRESDGALCLFLGGFVRRDGSPLPLIVRKSDGGFNYATSDLATISHRVEELSATRIIYVVGSAQRQHFEMLFAAVRRLGWVEDNVGLVHLGFGNMLSSTGKPFKTREGGTVKLKDLLNEAVARARAIVDVQGTDKAKSDRGFAEEQAADIAEKVGLASVKYFDLCHALTSDYRFDLDTMVAMEGNTAPYLMYAYARIRSIGRRAGVDWDSLKSTGPILLEHPSEMALAKAILRFADTMEAALRELRPNLLTDYLYDLSKCFSRFYDRKRGVRVVDASPEPVRLSRLRLCDLTARTLKLGLHLLGIETLEEM